MTNLSRLKKVLRKIAENFRKGKRKEERCYPNQRRVVWKAS
jgi:hypothetical protein